MVRRSALLPVVVLALTTACQGGDGDEPAATTAAATAASTTATTTEALAPVPDDDRDYSGDTSGPDSPLPDQRGQPNPDPANVTGKEGAEEIEVTPRDDAGDYPNLQWAVDNVAPGGTVTLGPGAFFLGDGTTEPKHTVRLRHGLRVTGTARGGEWYSVVQGGGALDTFSTLGGSLESGPFRVVNESDENPVVFEDLWIRHWTAEAIYVEASQGFALRNSRLSDPVNTTGGGIRFVHALFTSGEKAMGEFTVKDNLVELGGYEGEPANDEQLLGVFYSNHDTVRVTGNTITTIDEAIEIIGNGLGPDGEAYAPSMSPGEITVADNTIEVTQTVDDTWPGRFALLVANNAGPVVIRDNEVTVRGKGWAFGLSGTEMRVADNAVAFEQQTGAYPPGAVMIGFPSFGAFEMGASLVDSTFTGNVFSGSVTSSGIAFTPGTNDSHGNTFDLGASLAALDAPVTLSIAAGVHDNVFRGDTGTVVDNSPPGSNDFSV